MPEASVLEFKTARVTLVSALAWRVVAELSRRYQERYDLRVSQVHPGMSIRGALYLTTAPATGHEPPALSLDLGGPSGTYTVLRRIDGCAKGAAGKSSGPFAGPMLSQDPSRVVDEIAAAWGLPKLEGKLPSSHTTTIVARTIAGVLESLIFRRESWRTTAGFCDNSAVGSMVPDWTAALGVSDRTISDARRGRDARAADFLSRYVMLHRCVDDNISLRLHDLQGSAWVFCMATGTATQMNSGGPGRVVDLPRQYEASNRKTSALVHELAVALD